MLVLLRDPGLDYESCHCSREIYSKLRMAWSSSQLLAPFAMRITDLIAKRTEAFNHTRAASEDSPEGILGVLARRNMEPFGNHFV